MGYIINELECLLDESDSESRIVREKVERVPRTFCQLKSLTEDTSFILISEVTHSGT